MNDMIKLTHNKRKLGAQSNSVAPLSEYPSATALHMGTVGWNSNSNSLQQLGDLVRASLDNAAMTASPRALPAYESTAGLNL